jgi:hypothetical protein
MDSQRQSSVYLANPKPSCCSATVWNLVSAWCWHACARESLLCFQGHNSQSVAECWSSKQRIYGSLWSLLLGSNGTRALFRVLSNSWSQRGRLQQQEDLRRVLDSGFDVVKPMSLSPSIQRRDGYRALSITCYVRTLANIFTIET